MHWQSARVELVHEATSKQIIDGEESSSPTVTIESVFLASVTYTLKEKHTVIKGEVDKEQNL